MKVYYAALLVIAKLKMVIKVFILLGIQVMLQIQVNLALFNKEYGNVQDLLGGPE
ncbi:hypothetical protein KM043_018853, partial [Ampulex compressa]